jgi:hypothetical protein
MRRSRYILAVDPGKTTGLALFDGHSLTAWQAETWDAVEQVERFLDRAAQLDDVLIVESFVIGQATLRKGRGENWSLESIGAIRYLHRRMGEPCILHFQQASSVMRFATNEKLRAVGWWTQGQEHARDATRHILTYLATRGELPDDIHQKLLELVD